MRVVSDSTPLIYLAKIGKLHFLKELFAEVLIPEEVHNEVVVVGKEKGYLDASIIEELIKDGLIIVKSTDIAKLKDVPIEQGEKAALSLALDQKIEDILIDEARIRRLARVLGLRPRGTLWTLSKLYEEGHLSKRNLKESVFELIQKGYRIREDVLVELLREIE
ncbi:MAG: DUF3368 domain-containing protein [Methanocellales archaeon]|nr:DUF3368 domain-containing protein [Methanocellales archaeon]